MKTLLTITLALALTGCGKPALCYGDKPHTWSKWKESGVYLMDNSVNMRRECTTCGWIEDRRK